MFDNLQSPVGLALSQLAAAREALCAADLTTFSRDELLELMSALETDARRRASVTHAVVAELDARGIAGELGCSSAG